MKKTFCLFLCLLAVSLMLVACTPDSTDSSTATTSGDSGSASVPGGNETESTTTTPEDESTAFGSITTDENGGFELPPIPIS